LVNRFVESQLWGNSFGKHFWGIILGSSLGEQLWGAALANFPKIILRKVSFEK